MKGVLDKEYAVARQVKRSHIYRLRRRTFEVVNDIRIFSSERPQTILDIGTADGLMLGTLKEKFPGAVCAGIEYACDLVACNQNKTIHLVRGDALALPMKTKVFDVVVATAIVEHLSHPIQLIHESFRVLKKNGILIVTTPHPFWEGIATRVGHLKKDEHAEVMTLSRLQSLFEEAGFKVIKAEQFMISPIGMPFEMVFERILKCCGLNFLLLNQVIVGRRTDQ